MKLVIVESPAKAKSINQYLGKDYTVLASYGHIRDLPSKKGSVVPEENFLMKYELIDRSQKYVAAIAKEAKRVDEIILATDPDREGEGIAWHVVEVLKEKKAIKATTPVKRIVFTEITKQAVQEAVKHPREIDLSLVDAQQARRALDYLFGFTLSPILWTKLPGCKSAGRVQSVALRIICERESEIRHFKREEYWDLHADFVKKNDEQFRAKLIQVDGQKLEKLSITNEKEALDLKSQMQEKDYKVLSVEAKQQKRNPQPPFITSTLQQDASRKLGFNTKLTMQLAQRLYEGINIDGTDAGLITYMRTDGVNISGDAVNSIRKFVEGKYGEKFLPKAPRIYKSKSKNAQEAHEAIRPTNVNLTPQSLEGKLDANLLKLYTLIWNRSVACQMESAIFHIVMAKITSTDNKLLLNASGSTMVFRGFYEVFELDDKEDDDKKLPPLEEGEKLDCKDIEAKQHFTEPPPRYNEASLIQKLVELGIGRPSTYSPILSVIQDRKYVFLDDKKRFIPENQGIVANAFLVNFFGKYVEYSFTADLEEKLDEIAERNRNGKDLLNDFWALFSSSANSMQDVRITEVLEKLDKILYDEVFAKEDKVCPACKQAEISLKIGKYGAFYSCKRYPDCSFTLKLSTSEVKDETSAQQEGTAPTEPIAYLEDHLPIYLKKGPYGWYLQVGNNPKDPGFKRVGIPSNIKLSEVDHEIAKKLASLPRKVGFDKENNEVIAAIGRYGPYLKYKDKSFALPKDKDPYTIDIESAMWIIENNVTENKKPRYKRKT